MPPLAKDWSTIRNEVDEREAHHLERLEKGLVRSYADLAHFQDWVREWMRDLDLRTEEFRMELDELESQPACRHMLEHEPSALLRGMNVVGIEGDPNAEKGLLLYAHADKFPRTYAWARERPVPERRDGRIIGPGVADDVAGVVAMLSAVETCRRLGLQPQRPLLCGSLLGKQLSVLGTFGMMKRYPQMADAIYVHPPESGDGLHEIHHTSNGALEFHIEIEGRAPETKDPFHVIYDRGAVNAVDAAMFIVQALHDWAAEAARRYRYPPLEEETGRSIGLLVPRMHSEGSDDVLQVAMRCVVNGVVCFPPTGRLDRIRGEVRDAVERAVAAHPRLSAQSVTLRWGDNIGEACATDEDSPLVQVAQRVLEDATGRPPRFTYAYSLSDIRYPLLYWGAQVIGIGPRAGALATRDEWVDCREYLSTIAVVAALIGALG